MEMRWASLLVATCALLASACDDPAPGRTYFDRNIKPILMQKCAGNTSGCHSVNTDDPYHFAAGNLDVTSYENIQKRRDVLTPFGAYPYPLLLVKAVGPGKLKFQYGNQIGVMPPTPRFLTIDVQHAGGAILENNSDAYFTLQNWLTNGATENGLKPATPPQTGAGVCSTAIPSGFDRTKYVNAMTQAKFDAFKSDIMPIIKEHGCNAGSCHGAPYSDFYTTCGDDDDQLAFNFSQAWSFVNDPVDDSQLLRIPLAVEAGGRGHTGGDQFSGLEDADYKKLKEWATTVGKLDFAAGDPGRQFFADQVQPTLLQRGCLFQACHSPAASNDFKLRSGAIGFFSAVALEKNYELLKNDFVALEFADARRGRAIAKTILEDDNRTTSVGGIPHRGGPVLETPAVANEATQADPAICPATYNPASMPPPTAFCTLQEWIRIERAALQTAGQVTTMTQDAPAQVVYVQRTQPATAGRLEFDTFQGGADLRIADTEFNANGSLKTPTADRSLLANCGLGASPDVQAPDVANDGTRIAFAGRASSNDPLAVYVVDINGTTCTRITPAAPASNGIAVHNFDPAWSPDGQWIVFASTRGRGTTGATKSRKRFLPQSDLWRVKVMGQAAMGDVEQVTVLSNSEVSPQFMREGRMTMTTEKVSQGFYQLSGRRENWDLTDYHPLLGQRKDSKYPSPDDISEDDKLPSIGYSSVTDIREASDGDFMMILSNVNDTTGEPANKGGAGALGLFNRSIGPFEADRNDAGYLPSVRVLDATEVYRGPTSLADGRILVSKATSPTSGQFDIVMFDPRSGQSSPLFGTGAIRVDAQLVYKYPARVLYENRRQLVFGGNNAGSEDRAVVHMPDAPMVFTVLTGNLRRGRPVEEFRKAKYLAVWSEDMCPASGCAANNNGIYENRTMLGKVKLADDGSVKVSLPARTGVVFGLLDGDSKEIVKMGEEHQLGPGEQISMGVSEALFDQVCGGCHGSITGSELDVRVSPDALTGASKSASADKDPTMVAP